MVNKKIRKDEIVALILRKIIGVSKQRHIYWIFRLRMENSDGRPNSIADFLWNKKCGKVAKQYSHIPAKNLETLHMLGLSGISDPDVPFDMPRDEKKFFQCVGSVINFFLHTIFHIESTFDLNLLPQIGQEVYDNVCSAFLGKDIVVDEKPIEYITDSEELKSLLFREYIKLVKQGKRELWEVYLRRRLKELATINPKSCEIFFGRQLTDEEINSL